MARRINDSNEPASLADDLCPAPEKSRRLLDRNLSAAPGVWDAPTRRLPEMRLASLLLLALLAATWAGACSDENLRSSPTAPPPPPNEPPRASLIPLPDVILEVGSSVTVHTKSIPAGVLRPDHDGRLVTHHAGRTRAVRRSRRPADAHGHVI